MARLINANKFNEDLANEYDVRDKMEVIDVMMRVSDAEVVEGIPKTQLQAAISDIKALTLYSIQNGDVKALSGQEMRNHILSIIKTYTGIE